MGQLITKEYQGMSFTFRADGYFNMTKAAQTFGKRLDNFFANDETCEYLDALSALTPDIPVVKVQKGNGKSPQVGTFAHPKLALYFARWLDVRFAVWCDAVIEDILTKKADLTITQPEQSATVAVTQAMPPDFMLSIQQLLQSFIFMGVIRNCKTLVN